MNNILPGVGFDVRYFLRKIPQFSLAGVCLLAGEFQKLGVERVEDGSKFQGVLDQRSRHGSMVCRYLL